MLASEQPVCSGKMFLSSRRPLPSSALVELGVVLIWSSKTKAEQCDLQCRDLTTTSISKLTWRSDATLAETTLTLLTTQRIRKEDDEEGDDEGCRHQCSWRRRGPIIATATAIVSAVFSHAARGAPEQDVASGGGDGGGGGCGGGGFVIANLTSVA